MLIVAGGKNNEENQKGQPGAPEAVLQPSRLEGQLDGFQDSAAMLQSDGRMMNF
jgi:hypothetical protein